MVRVPFLNVVSTIDHPTSGNVSIDGQDPHKMNDDELAHSDAVRLVLYSRILIDIIH